MKRTIEICFLAVLLSFCFAVRAEPVPADGVHVVIFQGFKTSDSSFFKPIKKNADIKLSICTNQEFQGNLKLEIPAKGTDGSPHWMGCDIYPASGTNGFDLNPGNQNNELFLWMYAVPFNLQDAPINVVFYDAEAYNNPELKISRWFKEKAGFKKWTRLSLAFNKLPETVNLHKIRKIQIIVYWPGTYYFNYCGSSKKP